MKTDTKAEYFFTLFNLPITETYNLKAILGFHTGLSFILPQGSRGVEIESANMVSVDGMFVGRGWDNKRIDTRGLALWENWVELRVPVVPGMIAVDFFFDAAASKKTPEAFFNQFTADDMFYSFGTGIRFTIPQFPFRILFTFPFTMGSEGFKWKDPATNNLGPCNFTISFTLFTY
jgi:outer membrane protein insertion porin family